MGDTVDRVEKVSQMSALGDFISLFCVLVHNEKENNKQANANLYHKM